jgi:hypothetical protein
MRGIDPSEVEGRERRRGAKRPMPRETGVGTASRQRERDHRTRLRAPARVRHTAVQRELREVCWQQSLPIRGALLRRKLGSSYAPALPSSRDSSSRWSGPRADRTANAACAGTGEGSALTHDTEVAQAEEIPSSPAAVTLPAGAAQEDENRGPW